jgi:hypothetical protein
MKMLALVLMLGPWATDLDEDRLADAYAEAIQGCRGIAPVACDALQGALDALAEGEDI